MTLTGSRPRSLRLVRPLCLVVGVGAAAATPPWSWTEAVLPEPSEPGWGLLWTCDSMAATQEKLAETRLVRRAVNESGHRARAACASGDGSCLSSLAPLRDSSARLGRTEDSLVAALAGLAARCPAPGWARLEQRRSFQRQAESAPRTGGDSLSSALARLARSSWKAAWLSGRGDSVAGRDLALAEAANPVRSPELTLRQALLVDRFHPGEDRIAPYRLVCEPDTSTRECRAAKLRLGQIAPIPLVDRLDLLASAERERILAPTAWETRFQILDSAGRTGEAAIALGRRLLAEGGRPDTAWLQRLASISQRAGIAPDSLQRLLSAPWADTLFLFQARERIRSGDLAGGMAMLAQFQVRFPRSRAGAWARDWLGKARRKDPQLLGK